MITEYMSKCNSELLCENTTVSHWDQCLKPVRGGFDKQLESEWMMHRQIHIWMDDVMMDRCNRWMDEWMSIWMVGQTDRWTDRYFDCNLVINWNRTLLKVIYIYISLIVKKYTPLEHVHFVCPLLNERYCIFVNKYFYCTASCCKPIIECMKSVYCTICHCNVHID